MQNFARFWAQYPRRVGRKDAEKAWRKIAPSSELVELILSALETQADERRTRVTRRQWVPEIPHPATWLRGARWEDEPMEPLRMTMATAEDVKKFREDMELKRAKHGEAN